MTDKLQLRVNSDMKKSEKRKYAVRDVKCYDRECFVPFSGNGQKICRLYEMGQCPKKYRD